MVGLAICVGWVEIRTGERGGVDEGCESLYNIDGSVYFGCMGKRCTLTGDWKEAEVSRRRWAYGAHSRHKKRKIPLCDKCISASNGFVYRYRY